MASTRNRKEKKKNPRTRWVVPLPVSEEEKSFFVMIAKKYRTTYPALLAELLRRVVEKGLVDELLSDIELPPRYQRRNPSGVSRIHQIATTLGYERYVATPDETPKYPWMRSPSEGESRSLKVVDQTQEIPETTSEPASKAEATSVVARRRTTFEKLVRMCELPGEYLDEECDSALERWISKWGELTELEEQKLAVARKKRFAAYRQWKKTAADFEQQIESARLKARQQQNPRHSRVCWRKVNYLEGEFRAFKIQTRWDKRNFGDVLENK